MPLETAQKPYHHGDLRRALMIAALEQLQQGETTPLNFNLLAKAVGVSHSAVYRHFPEKQALIDALAQYGFEQLKARFTLVESQSHDSHSLHLRALGRAYVQFARDEPVLMRLMFSGISSERKQLPALKQAAGATLAPLRTLVQSAHAAGELLSDDQLSVALFYWSSLHGLAELLSRGQLAGMVPTPQDVENLIESTLDAIQHGTFKK